MTWHTRLGTDRAPPKTRLEPIVAGTAAAAIIVLAIVFFGG